MEYGADKYCKEKAATFQDRINHLSVEPLGRQLDCILGKYYSGSLLWCVFIVRYLDKTHILIN